MGIIAYPYIPEGRTIFYVTVENPYMHTLLEFARGNSLDKTMPGAALLVRDGMIIGIGANGSSFHETNGCERVRRKIPTGQGYELCEGCHPKNHSEPKAIANAVMQGHETAGADLYLWGHWWCCEPCWKAMEKAGVRSVFLLSDSEVLFNRERPGNIVGRQFTEWCDPLSKT